MRQSIADCHCTEALDIICGGIETQVLTEIPENLDAAKHNSVIINVQVQNQKKVVLKAVYYTLIKFRSENINKQMGWS